MSLASSRWRAITLVALAILVVLVLLLLPACCCVRAPAGATSTPISVIPRVEGAPMVIPPEAVQKGPTETFMRNVDFHIDPTTVLRIHELRGQMHDREPGRPLNLDDKRTFIIAIASATIGLQPASLDNLMNRYVFGYPGAPLRNLSSSFTQSGQLRQDGIMHKVIDIPFTLYADVSATPAGWIRLHPTKIEICNLNGAGLMKALGVTLEKMLDLTKAHGVRAEKNDLVLDPQAILPPPAIEGHLASVRVEGGELVQQFSSPSPAAALALPVDAPNTMYFRHGTLRIGKLLMVDADMQVIDDDPSDWFDFFIDRYNEQLVAGRSQNRLDYGLTVYMRDFSDLGTPRK